MTLTEQVLLHRDAQLLGMMVILEHSPSVPSVSGMDGLSKSGQLGEDFCKLFKLKQSPVFSIPVASTFVQKISVASSSLVSPPVASTLVTSVPVSSVVSQAPSSSSTRTSVLSSTCSAPSTLPSPNLE